MSEAALRQNPGRQPDRRGPKVVTEQTWRADAACKDKPVDLFFPKTGMFPDPRRRGNQQGTDRAIAAAKAVCAGCGARSECLDYALDAREPDGIFGGTTPHERTLLRRKLRGRTA